MNSLTLKCAFSSILISLIPFSASFLPIQKASAQITPDSTLGDESSVVNQLNQFKSLIEGGAVRGENLFHSFLEFNVGNGQSVYFVNPDGVNNILTRVTGDNISQILGTLGINGNANLFLINPNGFIFGNGAKLDLNGSFTATTGDIKLGEDGVFSATDTQGSSLLSVKPQAVFANFQGQIENRANLVVRDGEKIILMADKVVNTGNLIAPQGLVKLEGNEVNISGNSVIDVSGNEGAGAIAIRGTDEVNIGENVSLTADALVSSDGGVIEITSQGRVEFLGSISATGENPGEVTIDAPTVINHGVIDLGAENSEGEKASEDGTEEEKAIASESENGKAIASDSEPEPKKAIANSNTQSESALATNNGENNSPLAKGGGGGLNPRLQPDTTLGTENTQIEAIDEKNDRVIGGAKRGVNLFHSFGEFNIETDKGVYFANPIGIDNILARVTGNNISEIRGTLGVKGSADLYFINPQGIVFGSNARIDVGGSFVASSASSLTFGNGLEFSATNPDVPPMLTVNLTPALQYGGTTSGAMVKNEGVLAVKQGQNLTLAGETVLNSGTLMAPGGTIQVLGDYVGLLDSATLDVSSANGGGRVLIGGRFNSHQLLNAQETFIGPNVLINADGLGSSDGGQVAVWSDKNTNFQGTITAQGGILGGDGGFIETSAKDNLTVTGTVNASAINGNAGTWLIDPTNITITDSGGGNIGDSTVDVANINSALDNGTNVEIITNIGGTDEGNITQESNAAINWSSDNSLTLNADSNITLNSSITATGAGAVNLNAVRSILMNPDSSLTTNSGAITLNANQRATSTSGNFVGITIKNATITSETGNILLQGRGGNSESFNVGILLEQGAKITSTGGKITLDGTGGNGSFVEFGVNLRNANTEITSVNGNIEITGKSGGNGSGSFNYGIFLQDQAKITSTGTGSNAATITLNGTGGNGIENNLGVFLENANTNIKSVDGDISVTGNGGNGTGDENYGILLEDGAKIISTGTENITLNGTGGNGTEKNHGVVLQNGNPEITSVDGDISVTGVGGNGTGGFNYGILFEDEAKITSEGMGDITLTTDANGGGIKLTAKNGNIETQNLNSFVQNAEGDGGNISLSAGGSITTQEINSFSLGGFGRGGEISLEAGGSITTQMINSFSDNGGNGGDIKLTAINGNISTQNLNSFSIDENGGNITLKATNGDISTNNLDSFSDSGGQGGHITLEAGGKISTEVLNSFSRFSASRSGNGGDIKLTAGGDISTNNLDSSSESGNGGNITIEAGGDITTTTFLNSSSSSEFADGGNITLTAGKDIATQNLNSFSNFNGNGGHITLTATNGDISTKFLNSFAESGGNGGNITLEATNGNISTEVVNSFSNANFGENGTLSLLGDGGDIILKAGGDITTQDLNSFSLNENGGDITLKAGGDITTQDFYSFSLNENGGDITLKAGRDITTQDLNSFSLNEDISGNGGNITIEAREGNISFKGSKESPSVINSFSVAENGNSGKGGNINIITNGNFNNVEIVTVSFSEQSGQVEIFSPDNLSLNNVIVTTSLPETVEVPNPTLDNPNNTIELRLDIENNTGQTGDFLINTQGNLTLNNSNILADTKGQNPAGDVTLTSGGTTTLNNTEINSQTSAQGNAGSITFNTPNLILANEVTITTSTESSGNAGLITLNADESIFLTNEVKITSEVREWATGTSEGIVINTPILSISDRSEISAATQGENKAGDITITASNSVTIDNNSLLNVQTNSIGKAGNIEITTDKLTIGKDSELSAKTTINATGEAGNITINANFLDITGKLGIFAETDGNADAGNLNINPNDNPNLEITFFDEGQISSSTSGAGDGGDINFFAPQTIDLKGNGTIKVETTGTGKAGVIDFDSQGLNISEEVTISALTSGDGEAGSINLNVGDEIIIESGTSFTVETDGEKDAGDIELTANKITIGEDAELSARSKENATGKAGDIILNTNQLTIEGDKGIFASTEGEGEGGKITIQPLDDNLPLEISFFNDGKISASTDGSGKGGDIEIKNSDVININGDGKIQVETNSSGEAGSILINADNQLNLSDSINISASTFNSGEAGNINLSAPNTLNISGDGIIKVETEGSGNAGSILIESNEINLTDGIEISASTSNLGNSKNITLEGNLINLDDATIKALTTGEGNPGSILISNGENNANQVNLTNNSIISTEINAEGNRDNALPADVTINSNNLFLQSSQITASTTSNRDAGNINLTGDNFNLDNSNIQALTTGEGNPSSISISNGENQSNQVNITNNSTISTEINGEGNLDNVLPAKITINSDNLFLQSSQITASSISNRDAGNINLNNKNISLDNGEITAITQSSGDGGNIDIPNADNINLINNSEISASTTAEGKAGSLDLKVNQIVSIDSGSKLKVETSGSGDAGEIKINSPILTIGDDAELSARTSNLGKAGNVTIKTNQLNIAGELGIFAETSGEGIGGNLIINPQLNNPNLEINFTTNNGKISASTFAVGEGGDIQITASETINIDGNGSIKVETQGEGNAGDIKITTQNLNITGGMEITASTLPNENITTPNFDSGDAGNIILDANNININGSQINAFTNSTGNAGNINLYYQEGNSNNITLTNSTISTEIGKNGVANQPSNITIKTNNLTADNSTITASTIGKGDAGDITLSTQRLELNHQSKINAFTDGIGSGGSIEISDNGNNNQSVTLTNNSEISTEIKANGEANQPSDITIKTDNLTNNNSEITASTSGIGDAGKIEIPNAQQINLNQSEITVSSSGQGDTGEINLTATEKINLSNNSTISSSIEQGGRGNAQTINLSTPELELNQSQINAFTNGEGNAGSIIISNGGNNNNLVKLSNQSKISAEIQGEGVATEASNIEIKTNQLEAENSEITASTSGIGDAGKIEIPNAQQIHLNHSEITVSSSKQGDTGEINLTATEKINLENKSKISSSVETGGIGNSRQITINTPQLQLTEKSEISAETAGKGNAGQITIPDAERVVIDEQSSISTAILNGGVATKPANISITTSNFILNNDSEITASVGEKTGKRGEAQGEGGNIEINTTTPLILDNTAKITSALEETGKGKGGDIIINAPSLFLNNASEINASNSGIGNEKEGGGFVKLSIDNQINLDNKSIIATTVEEKGEGIGGQIEIDTQQLNLDNQSQIRASTLGQGDADSITINANTVELINGSKITTETTSEFDAGNITLNASESLFISDDGSGLFANTENGSTGDGGNINVNSPLVNLENQGAIAVSSSGEGIGGDIKITANRLNLDESDISAETFSTNGGNISLDIQELLTLNNNSNITATAGTEEAGGDGGNIKINSPFILSIPSNPFNTITAKAFEGEGGKIEITTNAIFGGEFLIIDASSQLGLDGEVIINDPDVDPTSGLIIIDANFIDAEGLIAQNPCAVENFQLAGGSSFVVIGKGGLPTQSADFLNNNLIITPWFELTPEVPLDSTSLEGEASLSTVTEKTSLFSAIYCRLN